MLSIYVDNKTATINTKINTYYVYNSLLLILLCEGKYQNDEEQLASFSILEVVSLLKVSFLYGHTMLLLVQEQVDSSSKKK